MENPISPASGSEPHAPRKVDRRVGRGQRDHLKVPLRQPVARVHLALVRVEQRPRALRVGAVHESVAPPLSLAAQASERLADVLRALKMLPVQHAVERLQLRQRLDLATTACGRGNGEEALVGEPRVEHRVPERVCRAAELEVAARAEVGFLPAACLEDRKQEVDAPLLRMQSWVAKQPTRARGGVLLVGDRRGELCARS
eukprot:5319639-Prymnesium_polylepis.1